MDKRQVKDLPVSHKYYYDVFISHHIESDLSGDRKLLVTAKFDISQGFNNHAAFLLHQATEHFCHTVLLVTSHYSPKSHKINFLRDRAEDIARGLIAVWPRDEKFARRCFELLQQAYVGARYSPAYKISDEELAWLVERVERLQSELKALAEKRLSERISS